MYFESVTKFLKSRIMTWEGLVPSVTDKIRARRVLVGKTEGKRPLGKPRLNRKDDIKMGL
jgi:hypothetical protein